MHVSDRRSADGDHDMSELLQCGSNPRFCNADVHGARRTWESQCPGRQGSLTLTPALSVNKRFFPTPMTLLFVNSGPLSL